MKAKIHWGSRGALSGNNLQRLMAADFDPGVLRPFVHNGKAYISLYNDETGKNEIKPYHNAATLSHEAWLMIDQEVTRAAQQKLKAVADLRSAGLTKIIPNGMGVPVFMTQRASRTGTAQVSMDPVQKAPNDRPLFDTTNIPLPVIFSDWSFSSRDLEVGRRSGLSLDTAMGEDAARAVAVEAEKLLIGNSDYNAYTYGGGTIYGYLNHPNINTVTVIAPTDSDWTGQTLKGNVLAMRQALYDDNIDGPFMVYVSRAWSQYLDDDYVSADAGTTLAKTIRMRINEIDDIQEIRKLDYLTGWSIVMVAMQSDTVRELIGMDITTVMWETDGGLSLNFKTMAILVPQIRADYDSQCGVCVGSTA